MAEATPSVDLTRMQGLTVLLAEDNVTNQLVATQMLENLGAKVDVAADGAIALERLAERRYDVLLVDIEMPRVSGLDVIRSVRASEGELSAAPVIALTAYAMQEHRDKIRQAGADGLIPKPIISIEQFGIDILTYMDEGLRRRGAMRPPQPRTAQGAEIDMAIFSSLAQSIGEDAMANLLIKIETDLVNVREKLAAADRQQDTAAMRAASHVLISVAGAIGGVRLQGLAEKLNGLAHLDAVQNWSDIAAEALVELELVLDFVMRKNAVGAANDG